MSANNGGGNPNHAGAGAPGGIGGQFISKEDAAAQGQGQEKEKEQEQKKTTTKKKSQGKFKKKPVPKLIIPQDSLTQMATRLQDLNTSANVPVLNDPSEIEQHIEKLFSQQVINKIDSLYGKTPNCRSDQFHPEGKQNVNLNIFTCVLGKYRYKDNHAHLISPVQYDSMAKDNSRYTKVYRGFTSEGAVRQKIITSYVTSDLNNFSIYGNGVYGTNIYTTTSYNYALGYAGGVGEKVMHALVDQNAKSIQSSTLEKWQRNLLQDQYDYDARKYVENPVINGIQKKLESHLVNKGMDSQRANDMSSEFVQTLKRDISLLAILMGYDYQISSSDQQRNILNLQKFYIRK